MKDMVTLCIDVGNTNTKVAVFRNDIAETIRLFSTSDRMALYSLLEDDKITTFQGAIISSVVQQDDALFDKLRSRIPTVILLNHHTRVPINLAYETPSTLGTDRIAAACAAWHKSGKREALSITCGTCIIYDYIDAHGNYQGGAISPGLWQRLKALHEFSARLPLVEPNEIPGFPGKNTYHSILAGVLRGMAYEIDGFIDELRQSEPNLHVFLSGGDAHYFATQLKNSIFAAPNLIMEGLNQILLFNVKNL